MKTEPDVPTISTRLPHAQHRVPEVRPVSGSSSSVSADAKSVPDANARCTCG